MRERLISILLLSTACLVLPTVADADIFRCVGAKGETLFTNISCPPGMRATTIITSAQACTAGDCDQLRDRDSREAAERLRAENEQRAIDAEEWRRREEAAALARPELGEAIKPDAAAPYDPRDGTATPGYPIIGVPATVIVLPSHHHRHHRMDDDRDEDRSADRDRHPMRDPKDRHEGHSAEHDRHHRTGEPDHQHGVRSAGPDEPKDARLSHSSRQVEGPHQRADDGQCRDRLRCAAPGGNRPSDGRGKS